MLQCMYVIKGIDLNDSNCTWIPTWNAYSCFNNKYAMLIVESMDVDSETRPLEPVALLGDGYLNTLDGPRAYCTDFNCRKRLSTFMSVVKIGIVDRQLNLKWCNMLVRGQNLGVNLRL